MGGGRNGGGVGTGNQNPAGALIPDVHGKLPGIHTGNADDAESGHDLPQGLHTAEIGGLVVIFPDDHGTGGGTAGLIVRLTHAVVADEGIGHDNGLTGVGGIGENFLITHHGGVENDLRSAVSGGSEAVAIEFRTVLQYNFFVTLTNHTFLFPFPPESFCSN